MRFTGSTKSKAAIARLVDMVQAILPNRVGKIPAGHAMIESITFTRDESGVADVDVLVSERPQGAYVYAQYPCGPGSTVRVDRHRIYKTTRRLPRWLKPVKD